MKKIAFCVWIMIPFLSWGSVDMTRVDPTIFIHQPLLDLTEITISNPSMKKEWVLRLFENDILNHEGTRAFSKDADFEAYYSIFEKRYRLIDLNVDGIPELLFEGFVSSDDEKEHLEIYCKKGAEFVRVYEEIGHILAYKIQPNTHEVLLFHHQYPCCLNASHNLNRLRLIEGKMQTVKRYFLGREKGDMKGVFFPRKTTFPKTLKTTTKQVELRWSGKVISKDAWFQRNQTNVIATYPKGAMYMVLASVNGWLFVRMQTGPELKNNKVVNPQNLQETAVYGWLKK